MRSCPRGTSTRLGSFRVAPARKLGPINLLTTRPRRSSRPLFNKNFETYAAGASAEMKAAAPVA